MIGLVIVKVLSFVGDDQLIQRVYSSLVYSKLSLDRRFIINSITEVGNTDRDLAIATVKDCDSNSSLANIVLSATCLG